MAEEKIEKGVISEEALEEIAGGVGISKEKLQKVALGVGILIITAGGIYEGKKLYDYYKEKKSATEGGDNPPGSNG